MPPSLSQRLSQIVEPLRAVMAAHASKHWAVAPLVLVLWSYLHRVVSRFASVTRRLDQGRMPRPSQPRPNRPTQAPRPPRLPQSFAWLARLAPEGRPYGSQLRHLLRSPEMQEVLAASPQAAKILRPLCRMLGIGPEPGLPSELFPSPKPRLPGPRLGSDPPAAKPAQSFPAPSFPAPSGPAPSGPVRPRRLRLRLRLRLGLAPA